MTVIREVVQAMESLAPTHLQETYDNAGLSVGNMNDKVSGIVVALDCTEAVIDEAIEKKCNLIITHHPLIFGNLKQITGRNYVEKCIIKAIRHEISIYASHTNLDSITGGVNSVIANKIGLQEQKILRPLQGNLRKLVTFCPVKNAEEVRKALFDSGSGHIGNYDHCSFNVEGKGTFRGGEGSKPHVGETNKDHTENEVRIETVFHDFDQSNVIQALIESHPYEEVAYDIYKIENQDDQHGIGVVGKLKKGMEASAFLNHIKSTFHANGIRYTNATNKNIQTVAVCGGSGSFLIEDARREGVDAFVTSDIKYHQFFDALDQFMLVDIGHYESEQFTVELIGDYLKENFTSFATHFSRVNTNPINYF